LGFSTALYQDAYSCVAALSLGAYFPHLRNFMNAQDPARKLWLVNYETRYPAPASASASAPADVVA
jgi:hypothetical protein